METESPSSSYTQESGKEKGNCSPIPHSSEEDEIDRKRTERGELNIIKN